MIGRVRKRTHCDGLSNELGGEEFLHVEPDGARIEPGDLEEVLDEPLEPHHVARQQVERGLRTLGKFVASRLHHLDRRRERHQRRAQFVAHVGREPRIAFDPLLEGFGHVVERLGEDAQIGIVGRFEARVEATAGDRGGSLRGGADRADGASRGEDSEQEAEAGGDRCGEQERQPDAATASNSPHRD